MSLVKALAYAAALYAIAAMIAWLSGRPVNSLAVAMTIGVVALERTYQRRDA